MGEPRRRIDDFVRDRLSHPARLALAGLLLAFTLGMLALGVAAARLELRILSAGSPPPGGVFLLPRPAAARAIAAGYTEAAADLVWTKLLVYFGEQTSQRRDPKHMAAYADSIISLDPMFRNAYVWFGFAIPLSTNNWVNPANVETGIRLLRAGVQRFPDDAELHGALGYNLFNELPRWIDDPDAIVRARVEGAEHLRRQAALGTGPAWLALSAATALQEINLDDLAARHLEESAQTVDDPILRERILARLSVLRSNVDTDAIRRATAALEGTARERLPCLPPSMFLLLCPPETQARLAAGLGAPPFVGW